MEDEGRGPGSSDFGALLRGHRVAAGLSQEALAERARVSLDGISALERGYRRSPQRETLALLAGALALSDQQRRAFESAAARPSAPRRRGETSVTIGPWPSTVIASLPLALTHFVGRDIELNEIAALVRDHRLVTLTGAGGIGKTQTALQAATALRDTAESTVCFVALAPIADSSLVATAIASTLGLQEVPNRPLLETLVAYLKNKTLLLVLDNCEHVITEAAAVAHTLLAGCPRIRILATSREPLMAAGERAYRLPSLATKDATALFADRALAVDAHFTLTDENATILAEVCRRLDGIPLAIELAAARVNVLPLKELAEKLDDRFAVLTIGERTAPPRQRTMRAAIDWSYDLLSRPEQRLFERLSVFAGGCTIDAARSVCSDDTISAGSVLDLMSSLVSKSLVVAELGGTEPRYGLLESFREYAREKLKARGEEAVIAHRHAVAYLELAEQFGRTRDDLHYTIWFEHPRDEIDNWRGAVQWSLIRRADVLLGQRFVGEIVSLWGGFAGVLGDARHWIDTALALVDEQTPPSVVARLKCAEANVARHLDNHTLQLASSEKAMAYYQRSEDESALVFARQLAGNALIILRRATEARAILEEGLSLARKSGSRHAITELLRELARASSDVHDLVAARGYLAEAWQLLEAADDKSILPWAMADLARLAFKEGNPELAVQRVTDLVAMLGESPWPRIVVWALDAMSGYLTALDRFDEAAKWARECLDLSREEQLDAWAAHALHMLAVLAVLRRQTDTYAKAARILGFVNSRLPALGSARDDQLDAERDLALTRLHEAMGAEAIANLIAEGSVLTEDEAVEEALAI
jgi:predicted ATPase/DNA-binding XRE family transcriptional regulator